jgi:hypothetical protein
VFFSLLSLSLSLLLLRLHVRVADEPREANQNAASHFGRVLGMSSGSEAVLTGYAVYAAYMPRKWRGMPSRFALYATLPTHADAAMQDGAARLDGSGKALGRIHVSSLAPQRFLSGPSLAQGSGWAGGGGGGEVAWPGTAWIRVVPRTDAGESLSKGTWCGSGCTAGGPLPVMPLPPPHPPTNLVAGAMGNGRVSLNWTPAPQPALLQHQVRFRISVATLLGQPGAQGKGSQRLEAGSHWVVVSEVSGSSTIVSGFNASDWLVLSSLVFFSLVFFSLPCDHVCSHCQSMSVYLITMSVYLITMSVRHCQYAPAPSII